MSSGPSRQEELFVRALGLAPADREAFLSRECGADRALLRRVHALLVAHEQMGDFLDRPASPAGMPTGGRNLAAHDDVIGMRIGRYKLLQKIGEGGCGAVYMAEQEEPIRRRVALKVIKLGMDTQEVIRRFESERQALALMDHPNIARVLDAGATDTGRPFFVMELVRGVPITKYCDENSLSTVDRLTLFTSVCRAVQHAHQKGIIHRDLKPSNILVTLQDGEPLPKVIDFGVAKATEGRLIEATLFTAFERVIGTPAYMSPEQAGMSSVDVDTRTDIYSLGVLLYELLTGQPPFDPKTLAAAGVTEMCRVIRETEPARPSARLRTLDAATLNAVARCRQSAPPRFIHAVSGDLDWIVMRCLEKNRARRYGTANELAQDVERHLHHEPVTARPPGVVYLLQKNFQRHRFFVISAGAVTAGLVVGMAASLWMFSREKAARQRAVTAERAQADLLHQAETEAEKSRQIARFLTTMLEGVGPSVAKGRDTALLREILDKTVDRIGRELNDRPEIEAQLRQVIGWLYRDLGDYGRSEPMLKDALALQRQLHGPEATEVAGVERLLAFLKQDQGDLAAAEPHFREALRIVQSHGRNDPQRAESAGNLAALYFARGKYDLAAPLFREQLQIQCELKVSAAERTPAFNGLLVALAMQGDLAAAEKVAQAELARIEAEVGSPSLEAQILRQISEIVRRGASGPGRNLRPPRAAQWLRAKLISQGYADSVSPLAIVLLVAPNDPAAETLYRSMLDLQQSRHGEEHATVAEIMVGLGAVLAARNQPAESDALLRRALAIQRRLLGNHHASIADSLQLLGWNAYKRGDFATALSLFREADAICRGRYPRVHPAVAEARFALAVALQSTNGPADARPVMAEVLAIRRQVLEADDLDIADTLVWVALLAPDHGADAEAEGALQEALSMRRGLLGSEHPDVAEVLAFLSRRGAMRGSFVTAEKQALEAWQIIQRCSGVRRDIQETAVESLVFLYTRWAEIDPTKEAQANEWLRVRRPVGHPPQ